MQKWLVYFFISYIIYISMFFIITKNVLQMFKSRQCDGTGIIKQWSVALISLSTGPHFHSSVPAERCVPSLGLSLELLGWNGTRYL